MMVNFSSALPRIGSLGTAPGLHGPAPSPGGGFDMGGFPGFDIVQRLLMNFGLDPNLLGMSLLLLLPLLLLLLFRAVAAGWAVPTWRISSLCSTTGCGSKYRVRLRTNGFHAVPGKKVTLGMSLTLVTSLLSFFTYSFGSITTIGRFMSANLVSSATVHSSDVTYLYIMRWLAVHKISTDCRLFCVTSRKNPQSYAVRRYSSYAPYGDGNRACQEDDEDGDDDGGCEDSLGPRLKYTPAPGKPFSSLLCVTP